MVVGAPDAEQVFVYDLQGSSTAGAILTLGNPNVGDPAGFGTSVAIAGTRVIVGAPGESTAGAGAGAVFVFDLQRVSPTVPVATLRNPAPVDGDGFGGAVAISGTRVVVGVAGSDVGADDAGRAYVFDLSVASPTTQVFTLNNPVPGANDQFGTSVGISGLRVVVGALGADASAEDGGAAYIYNLSSVAPTAPIGTLKKPVAAESDLFGYAVAISGSRVVVGAVGDDRGAVDTGAAYVYDIESATPEIPVAMLDNPEPVANDRFGEAVAISGTQIVIGCPNANNFTGKTFAYDLASESPTTPTVSLKKLAPQPGDNFGFSVAIDGSTVAVSSPYATSSALDLGGAFVFVPPTRPEPDTLVNVLAGQGGESGTAVAISGRYLVVGNPGDSTAQPTSGSATIFDLASDTPTVPAFSLSNPVPSEGSRFGGVVAISGTKVVIGAPGADQGATDAGSAYVYDLSSATPTVPTVTLLNGAANAGDSFGASVGISGNRVVVGAFLAGADAANSGRVYVYDLTAEQPGTAALILHHPSAEVGALFGSSLAIDGAKVVVGAPGDDFGASGAGRVFVYDLDGMTPTEAMANLPNPSPEVNDRFGNAVAISRSQVVVAALGDSSGAPDAGSVYVYDLVAATPSDPQYVLSNPDPSIFGLFGTAVSISKGRVAVGAPTDSGANGNVCVFDLTGTQPTVPAVILIKPDSNAQDNFGSAVCLDGTTLAIGAPFDPNTASYLGATYVYGSFARAAITVEQPVSTVLIDGNATISFGALAQGLVSPPKTFTIRNIGVADLENITVTIDGLTADEFTLNATATVDTLLAGGTTTFNVTFAPRVAGQKRAVIHVLSNVPGTRGSYDINLTGVGGFGSYFFGRRGGQLLDVLEGLPNNRLVSVTSVTGGTAVVEGNQLRFSATDFVNGGTITFTARDSRGALYTDTVRVFQPGAALGTFFGILYDTQGVGRVKMNLNATAVGGASGTIAVDAGPGFPFKGDMTRGNLSVYRSDVPLIVKPVGFDDNGAVSLSASYRSSTGELLTGTLLFSPYSSTTPVPNSITPKYTAIARLSEGSAGPSTAVVLALSVARTGKVTYTGRLVNGLVISGTSSILADGGFLFYYAAAKNGRIIRLSGEGIIDSAKISGSFGLLIPAGADARVSVPVLTPYDVMGSSYVAVSVGSNLFDPTATKATITLDIPTVSEPKVATVAMNGAARNGLQRAYFPNQIFNGAKLDLNLSNGLFTGTYYSGGVHLPFYGAFIKEVTVRYGQGFILDKTAVGDVSILAAP